jgi:hypothetical protein
MKKFLIIGLLLGFTTQANAQVVAPHAAWMGPTSGSPALPSWRALANGDLPAVDLSHSGAGGVTGNLPVTNLNNGTGANGSTFWAGDHTWKSAAAALPAVGSLPGGRLTLQTGTPVMITTQAAQTTVYYDCFHGANNVPFFDGAADSSDTIPACEVSTAMSNSGASGIGGANVFDVWWFHNGGTPTICIATDGAGHGWSGDTGGSDTARGTGYSQLDTTTRPYITNTNALANCYNGVTNLGSIAANQATYLGTIATDAAAGSVSWQFATSSNVYGVLGIWNAYNRVDVSSGYYGVGGTWASGATGGVIQWPSGSTPDFIKVVRGLDEDAVLSITNLGAELAAGSCFLGIALDGGTQALSQVSTASTTIAIPMTAQYSGLPGIGLHSFEGLYSVAVSTVCSFYFNYMFVQTKM